jgi:hypothetical protein
MFENQIEEVEKEVEYNKSQGFPYDGNDVNRILLKKLSILKEYQAKFDKLKELLKQKKCHGRNFIGETEECFEREWNECIDKLSSKEEVSNG